MHRTAVINVVGLTEALIGPCTPALSAFLKRGSLTHIAPALPAVTCTAQSTYLTGSAPSAHGIVGNGWYNRELSEVQFWKQSNHLVHGRKLWEDVREQDPSFTCAKLFWWYNMYSTADYSITPRPMYPADGRKVFDVYTWPYSIRPEVKSALGEFPFPAFWGPGAGRQTPAGAPDAVSRWIAKSAQWIEQKYQPTLSLIYLPHLDYNLQRFSPVADFTTPNATTRSDSPYRDLREVDAIVGELITFFESRSVQVVLLSEYGLVPVDTPVHLNRLFRQQGWLTIKDELGLELLDCGASKVFAVADHQVAHIYINHPELQPAVLELLSDTPGVARVLDAAGKQEFGIAHPRSGDLVALAAENAWFTYYYWLDDSLAPDFARTVDIHRKPGYDPVELFIDPQLSAPKLHIAKRLLQKKLGFRMLMDVIPLDATLVKGSHGVRPKNPCDWPVLIRSGRASAESVEASNVYGQLRNLVLR
jgi:predicted AlkP superfamily pyrophosphatase or phosphodiesterase